MNSSGEAKAVDNKNIWRIFSIPYGLICAVFIITLPKLLMITILWQMLAIFVSPKIEAGTFSSSEACVFFGISSIIWLTLQYLCGHWYVTFASKAGGLRRASLALTLTIIAGIASIVQIIAYVYLGFAYAGFFAIPVIIGELLLLTGMILSLRSINKQNKLAPASI